MNAATKVLREEHEAILKMLDVLQATAERMETGAAISLDLLHDLHEFFTVFADRCHHGKEEDLLFPLLEQKGLPRIGGPVGCMLSEHDEGRHLVQSMGRNSEACSQGDPRARKAWAEAAHAYAQLLRNHIWKENEILFKMAEQIMSADEQTKVFAEFEKVEEEKLGAGTHARLHEKMVRLSHELAASAK